MTLLSSVNILHFVLSVTTVASGSNNDVTPSSSMTKVRLPIRFQFRWWSWLLMRLRHSWLSYSTVPCLLATSRPHSKKPLSRRQLRSLVSMSQMLSRTVRSLIFRWCLSYLSGLSHSNSTPIYSPPVFCRLSSLAFGRAIRSGVNPNIFWGGGGEIPLPCPPLPSLLLSSPPLPTLPLPSLPPVPLEVGPLKSS